MPVYRFYRVDTRDHVAAPPKTLDLADDDAAVEEAMQLLDGKDIEVWCGTRLVVRLPHKT